MQENHKKSDDNHAANGLFFHSRHFNMQIWTAIYPLFHDTDFGKRIKLFTEKLRIAQYADETIQKPTSFPIIIR